MKSFIHPYIYIYTKLHIKNQSTESQLSPKWHSKGTQGSHQDRGDCRVSQEVSNLANSHCQENQRDGSTVTELSPGKGRRPDRGEAPLGNGDLFATAGEKPNVAASACSRVLVAESRPHSITGQVGRGTRPSLAWDFAREQVVTDGGGTPSRDEPRGASPVPSGPGPASGVGLTATPSGTPLPAPNRPAQHQDSSHVGSVPERRRPAT